MSDGHTVMKTIHAAVSPQAIEKVTRFYDATVEEILTEVMQNARRAGANGIDVRIRGDTVMVIDDGEGIVDPGVLVAFGDSAWQGDVAHEDPAGMGLLALARRGCKVESRSAPGQGWRVALEPEVFAGARGAEVVETDRARAGTEVTFTLRPREREGSGAIEPVRRAARYLPVPVRLSVEGRRSTATEEVEVVQGPFVSPDEHVVEHQGVRIGVSHAHWYGGHDLSFHGHTLRGGIGPEERMYVHRGHRARVHAEIHGGCGLALVLPARRDVIRDAGYELMQRRCREAVFSDAHWAKRVGGQVLESWNECTGGFQHTYFRQACEAGYDVPEPRPRLKVWGARPAADQSDGEDWDGAWETVAADPDHGHMVMDLQLTPCEEAVLERALKWEGREVKVWRGMRELEGYPWYDRMARVKTVRSRREGDAEQAERIVVTIGFENAPDTQLESDVHLAVKSPATRLDDAEVAVLKEAGVGAWELAEMLHHAFWIPDQETGWEHCEHECEMHRARAEARAAGALQGKEVEYCERIRASAEHTLRYLTKKGTRTTIRIDEHGHVEVEAGHTQQHAGH